MHRVAVAGAAAAFFLAGGCGTSGSIPPRPIETLVYVSGGPGLQFIFPPAGTAACGSGTASGIQSPNASHQFGDRVFQTPHLFVMENILQPVRLVIQNIDSAAIRVDTYLGQTPQNSNVVIQPGDCMEIQTTPGLFVPNPQGVQTQLEVCSPTAGLTTSCLDDLQPTTTDRNIAYFASLGDLVASNFTNCILPPILDACRSPSTFFVENPQHQIDASMSVNSGQNPPGQPTAEVRLELYLNGVFSDFEAGTNPIVSATL